jgi:hypothetical protein
LRISGIKLVVISLLMQAQFRRTLGGDKISLYACGSLRGRISIVDGAMQVCMDGSVKKMADAEHSS